MTDFFVWTKEELGVSVDAMDKEHQILIDKMNALHRASHAKAPKEQQGKLLEDLAQYTVKHFRDEEGYMESINYEGLVTHKLIHQQLLTQLEDHADQFRKTGELTPSFFSFLKVWLSSHIKGIDRKYSAFTQQKKTA